MRKLSDGSETCKDERDYDDDGFNSQPPAFAVASARATVGKISANVTR